MKKITLLLAMALASLGMNAQNAYTLTSAAGQPYADLTGATSINNGEVWDWDTFSEVNLPFSFSVAGQPVNRFLYDDDYFVLLTPTADYDVSYVGSFQLYPVTLYTQDRAYSSGTSASPLSYKTEGTAPNRILKLEMKNVGSEDATSYGFEEDALYMNFQVWLYEGSNKIEFHYGANNIPAGFLQQYAADEGQLITAIFSDVTAFTASGNATTPVYGQYTEDTFPLDLNLNAFPANGAVYTFTPAATAGTDTFKANAFSLYPNPASDVLNITAKDSTDAHYAIYNIMGSLVAEGNLTGASTAINTSNLQGGVYVLSVGNTHHKFIKK